MANRNRNRGEMMTTGEAAALIGLSINTIVRAFDRGRIKGFRIPSGKAHPRRFSRDDFRDFCVANNIPTEALDADTASLTQTPGKS